MLSPKNSASGQTFIIKLICSKQRKSQPENLNGGSQKQRTAVILHKIKITKCRKTLWHIAFRDKCGQSCGCTRF